MQLSKKVIATILPLVASSADTFYFANGDFILVAPTAPADIAGTDCHTASAESICLTGGVPGRTAWATDIKGRDWTPIATDVVLTAAPATLGTACVPPGVAPAACFHHPYFMEETTKLVQIMPDDQFTAAAAILANPGNCLFQWNIGGLAGTDSAAATTLQACQEACIAADTAHLGTCDVWTFTPAATPGTGTCKLYASAIWDTLAETPADGAGVCKHTLADHTDASWATCPESDVKICAFLDGRSVSGMRLCDTTKTPNLARLQQKAGDLCIAAVTTTNPPDADTTTSSTTSSSSSSSSEDGTTGTSSGSAARLGALGGAAVATLLMALF